MQEIMPTLNQFLETLDKQTADLAAKLPSKSAAHDFVDHVFALLFPINGRPLQSATARYEQLLDRLMDLVEPLAVDTIGVTDAFFAALPALYAQLMEDARATLAFDPAATSIEEVISAYPGFYATAIYRLAHAMVLSGINGPRIFSFDCGWRFSQYSYR